MSWNGERMEATQYITPDGETYNFETGERFLLTEEGLGMPDIKYITQRGPAQHGETYLDYRLEPRIIQYVHRVNGCSRDVYWQKRRSLVDFLRPNRQAINAFAPGTLRKSFPDGSMRDIKVHLISGPKFGPRDTAQWDEWGYTETLRFVAPDPTFYDPTAQTITASYDTPTENLVFYNASTGPTASGLVFYNPVTNNVYNTGLLFAVGIIEVTTTATNSGNWPVYPTITIAGPVTGIRIDNLTTGETLQSNYSLDAGSTLIFNLEFGNKRVYIQGTSQNILPTLTTDSDLATFHLEPNPGAANGVNSIRFLTTGASDGVTAISMSWYNRYIAQ